MKMFTKKFFVYFARAGFVSERGPATNELIDQEIHRVLQQSYERVKDLLSRRKVKKKLKNFFC